MTRPPRVGFLGTGWIGLNRMAAIVETGAVEIAGIVEPSPEMAAKAAALAPGAVRFPDLDAMLAAGVDGVAIATPSALHAAQAEAALRAGAAVFCQKPLGRTEAEVRAVVDAARAADRLLAVDLSYRFTAGAVAIRNLVRSGALGTVFAADLTFHNAYGPDKPWFYDPALSGGGCVMDLGVHLVDLAQWVLGEPETGGPASGRRAAPVASRLFAGGERLGPDPTVVEDYATASFDLGAAAVRLACSWRLQAGQDAIIEAVFYGTEGGAAVRNVGGSFYDFRAERFLGTARESLAEPPDAWGGRAAADWAGRLAAGARFAPEAADAIRTAAILDAIYGRTTPASGTWPG